MYKRITLLVLAASLILSLAGCGEPAPDQSNQAAPVAVKPKEEPAGPIYELTKDDIVTAHPDWTSKNIAILGAKLGDVTRNVEGNLGKSENSRTKPEEYVTIYQNSGLFIYTFKMTGKIRRMEVNPQFAKQIADEKLKKLLTGDLNLKYMRELLGPEESTDGDAEDKSTEYVYGSKGFRVVQYDVSGGKKITALRFEEPKKP